MMVPCRVTLGMLLALVLSCLSAAPIEAQPQPTIQLPPPKINLVPRAFVSASGADFDSETNADNNCGPVWPCRTITKALGVVAPGGEVVIVSSGDYEPFSILKPVSVVAAPGMQAVITATSGDAVTVEIPLTVVATVALRGLTLNGRGGETGINVVNVRVLYVEDCVLDGFSGNAIAFAGHDLHLRDTAVRYSGSTYASAVYIGAADLVSIDRLRMEGNRYGLVADSGKVTIRDSIAAWQVSHALWARGLNSPVDLTIENCTVMGVARVGSLGTDLDFNAAGIMAGNPSGTSQRVTVFVSNSTVAYNMIGISSYQPTGASSPTRIWVSNSTVAGNLEGIVSAGGAAIFSRGNNTLENNGDHNSFVPPCDGSVYPPRCFFSAK